MLDDCWHYAGRHDKGGYGSISVYVGNAKSKNLRAHRVMYENMVGKIPEGLVIDHLCRTPVCINPAHLEPVTTRENLLRGVGKVAEAAKKTHCLRGHEFNKANTYIKKNGCRYCRVCHRERRKTVHK